MCDCELPKLYSAAIVKTRKSHRCVECCREIFKGENVERVDALYDGAFQSFHTCKSCQETRDYVRENFDGWDTLCAHGELAEWLWEEGCYYSEEDIEIEASRYEFYDSDKGVVQGRYSDFAPKVEWLGFRVGGAFCLSGKAKSEVGNAAQK